MKILIIRSMELLFTLYLFRTVFPILLTAIGVYMLSQVFTFDYVENMDRSKLLSLTPIEKTVSKIIAGCIIVLGIFAICTLISVLIATFVTKKYRERLSNHGIS